MCGGEEGEDALVFECNIVLFFVVVMLVVDGGYYILDANVVDSLLEFKFLPQDFVFILEGNGFLWIRIFSDFGTGSIKFGDESAG